MTEKKFGARSIEVNGVIYKRGSCGAYWSEGNHPKVLPIISFDPREVTSDALVWDKDKKAFYYRHEDVVLYYKKLSDGQYVLMENQAFVVKKGEKRNASYIPWTVNDKGEVACHYEKEKIDIGKAQLTIAQKEYEKLPHSFVLPGFPLHGEVMSICVDAQSSALLYQGIRYRHLLEDKTTYFDTDDKIQHVYKNELVQISSEIETYGTIVPSDDLFKHFKTNTLNYLKEKERAGTLTEEDKKVLAVLKGGKVASFYEFAVATGIIDKLPSFDRLSAENNDELATNYVSKLNELQKVKLNTAFAMHYYMDQFGSNGLPELNLKGYNPHSAYQDIVETEAGFGEDRFFEGWHHSMQKRSGEAVAMQYIFSAIQKSPRWQDVSNFQVACVPERDDASRRSWSFMIPPVSYPLYYDDYLLDHTERHSAFVDKEVKPFVKDIPAQVRGYYYGYSCLDQAIMAMQNYKTNISEKEGNGRIPLYSHGVQTHTHQVIYAGGGYVPKEQNIDGYAESASRAATELNHEKAMADGSFAFLTLVVGGKSLMLGLSGVPGFAVAAGVCYVAYEAFGYVSQLVKEGQIQEAINVSEEIVRDLEKQRSHLSTRLAGLVDRPQAKPALQYVLDELNRKGNSLTPEEEKLRSYLEAEIKNPGSTTFDYVEFNPDYLENINQLATGTNDPELLSKLGQTVNAQSNAYKELAQVYAESAIYAYCLNAYYAKEKERETDTEKFNKARKVASENAQEERLEFVKDGPSDLFEVTDNGKFLYPPFLDHVTNNDHSTFISDRMQSRVAAYRAEFEGKENQPESVSNGLSSTLKAVANRDVLRMGYRAQYTKQAMRALTKMWAGDTRYSDCVADGLELDQCGASTAIVEGYTIESTSNALFDKFSYAKARKGGISVLEDIYMRTGSLTKDQMEQYKLLTKRVIRKSANGSISSDDQKTYNQAYSTLQKLAESNPQALKEEDFIFYLRLEYASLKKECNGQASDVDADKLERFKAIEEALDAYDSVTRLEVTSYAKYQKVNVNIPNNEQEHTSVTNGSNLNIEHHYAYPRNIAWNNISGDIQEMGVESYDFLSQVQAYMLSDKICLKDFDTSKDITTLFPSREERLAAAANSQEAKACLEEEFKAERDICEDIIAVFEHSIQYSEDLRSLCQKNGWLDKNGKFDKTKVCPDSKTMDAKAQADIAEKRCVYILRAIESDRHLKTQVLNMMRQGKGIDQISFKDDAKVSATTKERAKYHYVESLIQSIQSNEGIGALNSFYVLRKLPDEYKNDFKLEERLTAIAKEKGWIGKEETLENLDMKKLALSYLFKEVKEKGSDAFFVADIKKPPQECYSACAALKIIGDDDFFNQVYYRTEDDTVELNASPLALRYLSVMLKENTLSADDIKEAIQLMDAETLQKALEDETIKSRPDVVELIRKQSEIVEQETQEDEDRDPDATAMLSKHSEQNITTERGADGVDISYTAQRGRV